MLRTSFGLSWARLPLMTGEHFTGSTKQTEQSDSKDERYILFGYFKDGISGSTRLIFDMLGEVDRPG